MNITHIEHFKCYAIEEVVDLKVKIMRVIYIKFNI